MGTRLTFTLALRALVAATAVLLAIGEANGQWNVRSLHPNGADYSAAYGISANQVSGYAQFGDSARASFWSQTTGSWTDLTPPGSSSSQAFGSGPGKQAGWAHVGTTSHAILWSDATGSWADLNSNWMPGSVAYATDEQQQVGEAPRSTWDNNPQAILWSGAAASAIVLNPTGASASRAYGVADGTQVGECYMGNVQRASLWQGTAESWVDLSPVGSFASIAYGASREHQVGQAFFPGVGVASMWSGTANSWVNLHPPVAQTSIAYAVHGRQQVGSVRIAGQDRASLWRGTAASWLDLHSYLPETFSSSYAMGVWNDSGHTYVVGYGFNAAMDRQEALMWTGPATDTAAVEIISAKMISWKTLQVRVAGLWPGAVGRYRLTTRINGVDIKVEKCETGDRESEDINLDLASLHVQRFADDQQIKISVVPFDSTGVGIDGQISISIPIPVIVVQGIFTNGGTGGLDEYFTSRNRTYRYNPTPPYQTLIGLDIDGYGYDPDSLTLAKCSPLLRQAISDTIADDPQVPTRTYACRVDIVAHSKGGLVARQFLRDDQLQGGDLSARIRKLVLACVPNTGAVLANSILWKRDVYRELLPTSPWWRARVDQLFSEPFGGNATLKALNNASIPATIQLYIVYGETPIPTPASWTWGIGFAFAPGDVVVTCWSAQGYEVLNSTTGVAEQGPLIPAFADANIKEITALPYRHDRFLEHAAETLYQLLRAPG